MPIYEYRCLACGQYSEFLQKISDDPVTQCPHCQQLELKKQISSAAFHLKGGGWYVTDFRDKDKKKSEDKISKPSDKTSSTEEPKKSTETKKED